MQSNCYSISGVNDAEQFRIVVVLSLIVNYISCVHSRFIVLFSFANECCYMAVNVFQEALDVVHISKEDQQSVFAMLAAVLWLGDISFSVIDNENHVEAVTDEGKNFLKVKSKK